MAIDSAESTDTVDTTPGTTDSGMVDQAASAPESSPDTTGTTQGAIAEDGSINVDSLQSDQGSSTTPDTTLQTPDTGQAPVRNWEAELAAEKKRVHDLQSGYSRAKNDLNQIRQTYQGVDPRQVAEWQRAQAQAKQQNLPVWNSKNPSHQNFQGTLAKWKGYKEAFNRAQTVEQKQVLKDTLGTGFSQSEQQQIDDWEKHQVGFAERFAMDPNGTIAEIVQEQVQNQLQQHQQQTESSTEVKGWFEDPANSQVIQTYAPQMQKALADGVPWQYAKQMALDRARIERSQSREGDVDKIAAQARAQQAALRKNATISRDGRTAPVKDVAAEVKRIVKEKGWASNDPRVYDLVNRLSTQKQ